MPRSVNESRPTVPEVLPVLVTYLTRPGNLLGGVLYTVISNGNVGHGTVDACIEWAEERGDTEGAQVARLMRSMSKTQRGRLAHLYWTRHYPPSQVHR